MLPRIVQQHKIVTRQAFTDIQMARRGQSVSSCAVGDSTWTGTQIVKL